VSTIQSLISLVIPVFNEEDSLPALLSRLTEFIKGNPDYNFEFIFVDDGSTDSSVEVLRSFMPQFSNLRVITLTRNFGHQMALLAGMSAAKGEAVIFLDADLQDPPELIKEMLSAYREGFDIVSSQRISREGSSFKRSCYYLYYRIQRYFSDIKMLEDSGDFGLFSRRVVEVIKALPERHIYLRGLRSWTGYPQTIIRYHRPARIAGDSSYSLRKLVMLALDGILAFSSWPLRFSSFLGFITVCASFCFFLYSVFIKLFVGGSPVGFTALIGLLLFTSGVQLLSLGLIGEYIGRIYGEVKQRPRFIIREEFASIDKTS
jgi:polyisoprenyl-phosphate glycosyltransferase